MSPAQQVLDYRREIDENQKQVREMVMESYRDIAAGKGRATNFLKNWREDTIMTEYKVIIIKKQNFQKHLIFRGMFAKILHVVRSHTEILLWQHSTGSIPVAGIRADARDKQNMCA